MLQIVDQRRIVEEERRRREELEHFAYFATHDLREPLRTLTSMSQLLQKRYGEQVTGNAKDYLDFIVEAATRMRALIDDLVSYADTNVLPAVRVSTNTEEALKDTLKNLGLMIAESKATVTHGPLPVIWATPARITQLFQNLIGNALKFRGENAPEIHVSAEKIGTDWVFCVRDNGIGFEAEYAEQIFVIFKRLNDRVRYPGTGVGLAICKRILAWLGGRIWAESQPGVGTAFYFSIPENSAAASDGSV
jgi:light-regulated signal transduction histidine kinase (bacteriophytochrome)